jgi:hypothetical protein
MYVCVEEDTCVPSHRVGLVPWVFALWRKGHENSVSDACVCGGGYVCACVEYDEKATKMESLMRVCVEEDTCVCVCGVFKLNVKLVNLSRLYI